MTEYTAITGGASGSDLYWQKKAIEYGMGVQIMSFDEHNPYFHERRHFRTVRGLNELQEQSSDTKHLRVILNNEELQEANEPLELANHRLKRVFPPKSSFHTKLLQRNYFIVRDAEAVVVTAPVQHNRVKGGTAWGVEVADSINIPVYVYVTNESVWKRYRHGKFEACLMPKLPRRFAAIGTRQLRSDGKWAIDDLFEFNFPKS